jgi:putative ABC transport system permease protein
MRILNRFWAIFVIAMKRILSQPGMMLSTVLGMIFATSIAMSVPLYTGSVYNRIFFQRVGYLTDGSSTSPFPPFTFLFTYDTGILGNLQWEDLANINGYLEKQTAPALGLPVKQYTRLISTNPLVLFPASVGKFPDDSKSLLWSKISFIDHLQDHIQVMEGSLPQYSADGPIQVMTNSELATKLGLQVGEDYLLFARDQMVDGNKTTVSLPVRISGIYQASDPNEEYWVIKPSELTDRFMVTEEIFAKRVAPLLSNEIYFPFWFITVDGSHLQPDQAMTMVSRINRFTNLADQFLPKIKISESPVDALFSYQRSVNLLNLLLFAFSVPIFGLLLAFITMIASMTVERQRNEIAILRSRGGMISQMVGIATIESLVLGAVSLLISLPVSAGIAFLISHTRSFLDFSSPTGVALSWNLPTLYFGLGSIAVTILARLLPTFQAARDTIVVYKRDRARSMRLPFWQRIGLDFILLIPALYGFYQLRQSGSIDALGASAKGDPFTNPLLMMVPSLAIFSCTLIFLRIIPWVMRTFTLILTRTRSVGMMMATRHLARTPSLYALPLVLLILTLSLSVFTATLAGTLDHHLNDMMHYQVGADASFTDLGDSPEQSSSAALSLSSMPSSTDNTTGNGLTTVQDLEPAGWYFLPVSEYQRLPGVSDATRVGRFEATALLGGQNDSGTLLGIDRYNLANIAFWRPDFASESLGELMNRLAAMPDGVLVNDAFLARHALNQGDLITLHIANFITARDVDFYIAGTFHLFPTYYPSEANLFVSNLDYVFESLGSEYPYDVWLKTDSNSTNAAEMGAIATHDFEAHTIRWKQSSELMNAEQTRPERQGLFGVLSVGFGGASLLTVLGFMLYTLLSYQRRVVELGVLRAIGLSAAQMASFLAAELAFLIAMGGIIGTTLGIWVSNNFIPFLQVGADPQSQFPPYIVYIAWPAVQRVYVLFGLLFVVALVTLVFLLSRMKIFQAIKMGESV